MGAKIHHYGIRKIGTNSEATWLYHVWIWKNRKKGTKNIILQGHGYNTANGARNGMRAACRSFSGNWNTIKLLIEVEK